MKDNKLLIGLVGLALFTLLVLAPNLLWYKPPPSVETLGVMRAEDTTNWNLYVGFGLVNSIGPRTKSSYWVMVDSLGASLPITGHSILMQQSDMVRVGEEIEIFRTSLDSGQLVGRSHASYKKLLKE